MSRLSPTIPKTFEVMGHRVTVRITPEKTIGAHAKAIGCKGDNSNLCGLYDHSTHTIFLSDKLKGTELHQTFLHEKMHCLLESAGKPKLSENEGFVDLLSELLYQSIVTVKGSHPKR
jgi:hypothetical protein